MGFNIDWSKWKKVKQVRDYIKERREKKRALEALQRYLSDDQYTLIEEVDNDYLFKDNITGVRFKFIKEGRIERISE